MKGNPKRIFEKAFDDPGLQSPPRMTLSGGDAIAILVLQCKRWISQARNNHKGREE
jgi:hypothetical protein